jgi:cytochrome c
MRTRRLPLPAVLIGILSLTGTSHAIAQDAAANTGMIEYNNACRTCHSVNDGDNRLGPHLFGIVGRQAGTVEGFSYSPTLTNSSIVWTEETLDKFIADPASVASGTSMLFGGISDPEVRAAIITFLKSAK